MYCYQQIPKVHLQDPAIEDTAAVHPLIANDFHHAFSRLLDVIRSHCFSHQLEVLVPSVAEPFDLDATLFADVPLGGFHLIRCSLASLLKDDILNLITCPTANFR